MTRIEKDSLGEMEVPSEAYYGAQTARAVLNFPISSLRFPSQFISAIAQIKLAAAQTNRELADLDPDKAKAIEEVASAIAAGEFQNEFIVDVFQAGAGTSLHMNVNEVIANRACEILGGKRGDHHLVHPNDHVNMGQSTNDVIPTAIRLAAFSFSAPLLEALEGLHKSLQGKAKEFDSILKSGRTHLQDAVPVRLGQEFGGYARAVEKARIRISHASQSLLKIGIGGTAAGTGVNTHPQYRGLMIHHLSQITGYALKSSEDLFEAMQSMAPFTEVSGALRNLAIELIRISNDFRLLSSGPNTGLREIDLPAVQPGSSIMPGKVNPVMAEMLNMVCYHVIGADTAVTMAAQAGQLELNVMMPVLAYNLLHSFSILRNAVKAFAEKCVTGITANQEVCNQYAERTLALATLLNPYIGYADAAEVAKESLRTGRSIKEIVRERNLLSPEEFDRVFDPSNLTSPRKD